MSENKNVNDEFVTSDTVDQPKEEEPVTENDPISEEGKTTAEQQTPPNFDFGTPYGGGGAAPAYTINTDDSQNESARKQELNNAEITALVLGIISVLTTTCCCINIVLAIIAICFAVKTKKLTANHKMGSMALGGMICACISIGATVLIMALYVVMVLFSIIFASATYEVFETASFIMSLL